MTVDDIEELEKRYEKEMREFALHNFIQGATMIVNLLVAAGRADEGIKAWAKMNVLIGLEEGENKIIIGTMGFHVTGI